MLVWVGSIYSVVGLSNEVNFLIGLQFRLKENLTTRCYKALMLWTGFKEGLDSLCEFIVGTLIIHMQEADYMVWTCDIFITSHDHNNFNCCLKTPLSPIQINPKNYSRTLLHYMAAKPLQAMLNWLLKIQFIHSWINWIFYRYLFDIWI